MSGFTFGGETGATYGDGDGGTWGVSGLPPNIGVGWMVDDIVTDALVGDHPEIILGEEVTVTFKFTRRNGLDPVKRYEKLREDLVHSTAVDYNIMIDGTPRYREQHYGDSLVREFVPGAGTTGTRGFWGLIVGYEDLTVRPEVQCRVSLDVLILGDLGQYSNKDEVRTNLEM